MSESAHTVKLSNGAVLWKSGVALGKTTTPRKTAPGTISAPSTPQDMQRKTIRRKIEFEKPENNHEQHFTNAKKSTSRPRGPIQI